jgi:hypothetical protein
MGDEDDDCFEVARPGDHLLCPFQCEIFLFRNIQGISPLFGEGKLSDVVLLRSLRRANLDDFWSREPNTVSHNLGKLNRILQPGFELGMDNPPLPLAEPWPVKDTINAGGVVVILRHSLDPGRTEDTVQFETVRKMKSAMVNMARASAGFDGKPAVGGSEGKKYIINGDCVFHDWFDQR